MRPGSASANWSPDSHRTRFLSFDLLPLVMVYFGYGALGIIDVTCDMWIKESLTLSPAELAEISVWLELPWTVKIRRACRYSCAGLDFAGARHSYLRANVRFWHKADIHAAGPHQPTALRVNNLSPSSNPGLDS